VCMCVRVVCLCVCVCGRNLRQALPRRLNPTLAAVTLTCAYILAPPTPLAPPLRSTPTMTSTARRRAPSVWSQRERATTSTRGTLSSDNDSRSQCSAVITLTRILTDTRVTVKNIELDKLIFKSYIFETDMPFLRLFFKKHLKTHYFYLCLPLAPTPFSLATAHTLDSTLLVDCVRVISANVISY